jgi:MiaB/RimO family radical SAM methylthiotransferase
LGECSYCITKIAKGKLFSYPKEKIVESIKNDLSSGCKEIWLTSQDSASYGNQKNDSPRSHFLDARNSHKSSKFRHDEGKSALVDLLKEIVKLKGNFHVRIGMMNPDNVLKILPELIEVYKDKKIYKFLHLPLQSANDEILKEMKRKYTKKDFVKIVNNFRKEFPEMHFSTDVIVGFPGESEKDFNETYELIRELEPETINISKFWPRPHTAALNLDNQVDSRIKIERASRIAKLHKEICNKNQKKWLGQKTKVFVNQKGFGNTYLARDENYKLFAVVSKDKILGKKINVQIKTITPHYLICQEIE